MSVDHFEKTSGRRLFVDTILRQHVGDVHVCADMCLQEVTQPQSAQSFFEF
jgi:hypothetical protein